MSIHYVYICWCPWTLLCIILKIVTSKQTTTTLVNPWPFSVKVTTACKVNFHTVKFLKKVLKDYLSRYIVDSSRGGGLVSQLLIALISEPTLQHRALLERPQSNSCLFMHFDRHRLRLLKKLYLSARYRNFF